MLKCENRMEKKKMKNPEINKKLINMLDDAYIEKIASDDKYRERVITTIKDSSIKSSEISDISNLDIAHSKFSTRIISESIDFPLKYVLLASKGFDNFGFIGNSEVEPTSNYGKWLNHIKKLSAIIDSPNILYFISNKMDVPNMYPESVQDYYCNKFMKMLLMLYHYLNFGVFHTHRDLYVKVTSYMADLGLFITRMNDMLKYNAYMPEIVGIYSNSINDMMSLVFIKGAGYHSIVSDNRNICGYPTSNSFDIIPAELLYDQMIIYSLGFGKYNYNKKGDFFTEDQVIAIDNIAKILDSIDINIMDLCASIHDDYVQLKYDLNIRS